jgi:hypothetical protein
MSIRMDSLYSRRLTVEFMPRPFGPPCAFYVC